MNQLIAFFEQKKTDMAAKEREHESELAQINQHLAAKKAEKLKINELEAELLIKTKQHSEEKAACDELKAKRQKAHAIKRSAFQDLSFEKRRNQKLKQTLQSKEGQLRQEISKLRGVPDEHKRTTATWQSLQAELAETKKIVAAEETELARLTAEHQDEFKRAQESEQELANVSEEVRQLEAEFSEKDEQLKLTLANVEQLEKLANEQNAKLSFIESEHQSLDASLRDLQRDEAAITEQEKQMAQIEAALLINEKRLATMLAVMPGTGEQKSPPAAAAMPTSMSTPGPMPMPSSHSMPVYDPRVSMMSYPPGYLQSNGFFAPQHSSRGPYTAYTPAAAFQTYDPGYAPATPGYYVTPSAAYTPAPVHAIPSAVPGHGAAAEAGSPAQTARPQRGP